MVRVSAAACGGKHGASAFWIVLAAAAMAVLGFDPPPAMARGYFPWDDEEPSRMPMREWSPQPRPRATPRISPRRGAKNAGEPTVRDAKRADASSPERPLFAVVSIADQRISIYNHHGLVERSAISTGIAGHPTPKGVFTIIGRERFHRSNIYSGAPMPFMQRITWSGIAMHLGVVPGHPASHGCIRLPAGFAAKLWGLTRIGERVVISPHDLPPVEFAHPMLPTPKMLTLVEADKAAPAADSQQPASAAQPPLGNPRQYAERFKAKAAAEAAAAVKAVKEISAALGAKRHEAARAADELETAERAYASARAKAEAADKAYEAAAVAVGAKQQDSLLAAELKGSEIIDSGDAEVSRLAKALSETTAAKAAATIAKASSDAALAEATARLDAARTASAVKSAELADAVRQAGEATAAAAVAARAEKEAQLRMSPVSVLVSKKDRRIYVRQGLTPLFDAPASVRDPERPLGSHLYIATAAENDGASLKWTVLSMPIRADEPGPGRTKTASIDDQAGAPAKALHFASSPAEALDRVEISQEVRDRIAERLWTGGSLIISDQPPSGETGAVGTDLTVKLR